MDADRWRRISQLYHEALARDEEERRAFLEARCGDDDVLRQELESLLTDDTRAETFLAAPAAAAFADVAAPTSNGFGRRVTFDTETADGSLAAGTILKNYRIEHLLGRGGMGAVFLAYDTTLHRRVAIKLLNSRAVGTQSDTRLLREARNAAALNHPNIGTVYEVGNANGAAFIAMEYVEGRSLGGRIEEGPLALEEALRLGIQAADALAYAHEHGVLHRDFKAANTILAEGGRLKIVDFGLARRNDAWVANATTVSSLVPAGAVAGTPYAMAPEQVRGETTDARTDIWALGVLLYEMMTGARPFQGATIPELFSSILTGSPAALPDTVPVEMKALIERCLEKDPSSRFRSAGEVRTALEAIQAGTALPWVAWRYRLGRRKTLAMAGVALVALLWAPIGMNLGGVRDWLLGTGPRAPIQSIAVLPLQNLSGDPEQDYFADGFTDALITDLSKIGALKVISRTSVIRYKGAEKSLPEIARELGVDGVLEGSVLKVGQRVRITAQLIHAATDLNLWAERYERDLQDVLRLQSEVAHAVARQVRIAVTRDQQTRLAANRAVNPEAYELYLKGQFYVNKVTPEGFQTGLTYLNQAVEKDPADPLVYAGLALAYAEGAHMLLAPPQEAFPRAREAAMKALDLDDTLAEAHTALAMYAQYYGWDWAAAEESFRRALELSPNFAMAHQHHGWYLRARGRLEEALAELKRAKELDPLKPLFGAHLAFLYADAGQFDSAINEAQKVLELDPNSPVGFLALGYAYAEKGMYNEAIAAHERLATADPAWKLDLARTYAVAGQPDQTRRILGGLKEEEKDPWLLAYVYVALGDKNEAIRWLDEAYKVRHQFLPYAAYGREFAPLQGDPRFEDLRRRIGVPR